MTSKKRWLGSSFIAFLAFVALYESRTGAKLGIAAERRLAGLQREETQINGERWVWLEGGTGETVVLLHGFGGDKDNWTRFARSLHMHVLALDLPGFGEDDRDWSKSYDIAAQSLRLAAFIEARGLAHFHLAGNSMGGHLAAIYTSQHPERVLTLGLFDAAGVASPHESELSHAVDRGENPLIVKSPADFDHLIDFVFAKPPFIPPPVRRHFAERAAASAVFNEKIFQDYRARPQPLEAVLPQIRQRTLVLWGDTDRVIDPSAAEVMVLALPRATKVLMKDCGHLPMLERPEETAEIYQRFVRE
jgi:pimeloyl-ACP methyl ester carboxylesterase